MKPSKTPATDTLNAMRKSMLEHDAHELALDMKSLIAGAKRRIADEKERHENLDEVMLEKEMLKRQREIDDWKSGRKP